MRIVAYLRVSTDRQADEGFGLTVQEQAVHRWARQHGHKLVACCRDEGRSGAANELGRPGLADALAALHRKDAEALVVARLDRLARDLVLQEQLIREIAARGGRLHSCSPAEDNYLVDEPSDPTRRLIRQVLGAVAEHERGMIRLRMRAGAQAKAQAGGYAYGQPPYGWRPVARQLVPDETEQAVIASMVNARRGGASYRQIVQQLAGEGCRTRAGNSWSPAQVRQVILRAGTGRGLAPTPTVGHLTRPRPQRKGAAGT